MSQLVNRFFHFNRRQEGVVNSLFDPAALQCKNCGLRYRSSEMMSYTQHLDWHFRMRRREKDNAKKAQSRKWYFERIDWIISEEIEDEDKGTVAPEKYVEERYQNLFVPVFPDGLADDPNGEGGERGVSPAGLPSVPVSEVESVRAVESACPVCNEEFEQFFKEEDGPAAGDDTDGRWHYKNAIRPDDGEDGRLYHPQCYQDFKANGGKGNSSKLEDSTVESDADASVDDVAAASVKVEKTQEEDADGGVADAEGEEKMEVDEQGQQQKDGEGNDSAKEEPVVTGDAPAAENGVEGAEGTKEEPMETGEGESGDAAKTEVAEEKTPAAPGDEKKEGEEAAKEGEGEGGEKDEKDNKEEEDKKDESLTLDDVSSATTTAMAAPASKANIKINITTQVRKLYMWYSVSFCPQISGKLTFVFHQVEKLERRESVMSSQSEGEGGSGAEGVESELDPDAVVQEARPELANAKPAMEGKTFSEIPLRIKDKELSSLCSIM